MPYKMSAIPYLDFLSDAAEEIGAVNTVLNNGGKPTRQNTDAPAAQKLIGEKLPWGEKSSIILGAGGMAYAFAFALNQMGAKGFVTARNQSNLSQIAKKFNLTKIKWGEWNELQDKIICNATPIGMSSHKNKIDFPKKILASFSVVFDAVANSSETWLVKAAKNIILKL